MQAFEVKNERQDRNAAEGTRRVYDPAAFLRILHESDVVCEVRILKCPHKVGGDFPLQWANEMKGGRSRG